MERWPNAGPAAEIDGVKYHVFQEHAIVCKCLTAGSPIAPRVEIKGRWYVVAEYGAEAFSGIPITEITILNTILTIDSGCFRGSRLSRVTFPPDSHLTRIRFEAFRGCPLKALELPAGVEMIGRGVFQDCRELRQVSLPQDSHLSSFSDEAFRNSGIKSVFIPRVVASVKTGAFRECRELKSVLFGAVSRVEKLCMFAFSECAIESIELPPSVTFVGTECFADCAQLRDVIVPQDSLLREIGDAAFRGCPLKRLFLPRLLSVVGPNAFPSVAALDVDCANERLRLVNGILYDECTSSLLFSSSDEVTVPRTVDILADHCLSARRDSCRVVFERNCVVRRIGSHSFYTSAIQSIRIPKTCEFIGKYCFAQCRCLYSVTFEDKSKLKTIEQFAFAESALSTFRVPRKVTTIGESCFSGCEHLGEVDFEPNSQLKIIMDRAFRGCLIEKLIIPIGATAGDIGIPQNRISRQGFNQSPPNSLIFNLTGWKFMRSLTNGKDVALFEKGSEKLVVKDVRRCSNQETRGELDDLCTKEVAILFRLRSHPLVVELIGYIPSTSGIRPKIVTKFIEGRTLADPGQLTPTAKALIVAGLAHTMAYIHDHGVIHRDLEPTNVIIDGGGMPHICDFSGGRFKLAPAPFTQEVGTPRYIAPEMYKENGYDAKVDVFSYGMLLYEVVVGWPVYSPKLSPRPFMRKLLNGERNVIPGTVPEWLGQLIAKCWDDGPRNRPTFIAILRILEENDFLIEEGVQTEEVRAKIGRLSEYVARTSRD
jgi:hypothetical protein